MITTEKIVDKICWGITKLLPWRVQHFDVNGDKYLLRFYIKHSGRFPGLYLHHFYRGDSDRDLHNHPWTKSYSLVLTGGYREEKLVEWEDTEDGRKVNQKIINRYLVPGRLNVIAADDFHRVELLGKGAWTIFTSGRRVQDWGFLLKESGEYIDHETYEREKLDVKSA